ncbi:MAG: ABATE domain-containing protein, partial [Thermomicrobiales bacterium]
MRSRRRDTRQSADTLLPAESRIPLVGGRLSIDFVNTIERQQRSPDIDVLLPGYGNVLGWALSANILDRSQALPLVQLAKREPLESVAVRKRALVLREAIRGLLQGEPGNHLEALTMEWRVAMLRRLPVLSIDRPVVQWIWDPDLALDSLLWPVALDAMDLVTTDQRL